MLEAATERKALNDNGKRNMEDPTVSSHHIDSALVLEGLPFSMVIQGLNSWTLMRTLNSLTDLPWCIFGEISKLVESNGASQIYS